MFASRQRALLLRYKLLIRISAKDATKIKTRHPAAVPGLCQENVVQYASTLFHPSVISRIGNPGSGHEGEMRIRRNPLQARPNRLLKGTSRIDLRPSSGKTQECSDEVPLPGLDVERSADQERD